MGARCVGLGVRVVLRANPNSLLLGVRYQGLCVCTPRALAKLNSVGFAQPSVRWGDLLNLRVKGITKQTSITTKQVVQKFVPGSRGLLAASVHVRCSWVA